MKSPVTPSMKPPMKLLLALDDGPGARRAVDEAIRIAREQGATLDALFVIDATWDVFTGHDWLSGCNSRIGFLEYMQGLEEKAAAETARAFLERRGDLPGELLTAPGDVVDVVREHAARGYDLLVLSNPFTRGLEVMRDAVAKLTRDAPCDVLLVRPGPE
ncbi:universal stress protein [Nitratidesulfovibrio sp. HK-II]|uniref:universal stress protein n=1 Tax=Nitratidesulfovibrio sp. HK-II TaxID=2009266 RepID=UPI000EBA0EF9|nr:universal stress protein [Nitratidesulfovibrio sp. HK-II]GBO98084.1 hypothetical protein RVX_3123 [Nitratidesulfovibrio sp. HK-II]